MPPLAELEGQCTTCISIHTNATCDMCCISSGLAACAASTLSLMLLERLSQRGNFTFLEGFEGLGAFAQYEDAWIRLCTVVCVVRPVN